MSAITIQQLNNAALDAQLISDVSTSQAMTATDRLGNTKSTVLGAVNSLKAFNARGAFVSGTAYALKDVYTFSNLAYVAVLAHTSSSVAADLAAGKVVIHQGATLEALGSQTDATLGSALLTYFPKGSGGVPRPQQDRDRDIVLLTDYMSSAERSDYRSKSVALDLSAAIALAMAAVSGTACDVYCPGGTAKISSGVTVPAGVTLRGAGRAATQFMTAGSGYDAITLGGSDSGFDNAGVVSNSQRTSGAGIAVATNCRNQRVSNFSLQNQCIGVQVNNSVITTITDGVILNTTANTGVCIDILGGNDTFINRIVADNGIEPHAGIRIQKTDAVWMTDNDFIHCGNGLEISPNGALGQYVTWIFGVNNAFDSSITGSGTYINPTHGGTIRGVLLIGHWCASNVLGMGISTDASSGAFVDGVKLIAPRILNNKQYGIIVNGGAQVANVEIIDPTIAGNGIQAANIYDGITFGDNSQLFRVRGGKIGPSLGFGSSQRFGIYIGAGCSGYEINGVDLAGNASGPLANASWAASNGRVVNNNGALTHASGNISFAAGVTEVVVSHGLVTQPTIALVNPLNTNLSGISFWVGSFTSTTFKINFSAAATGGGVFSWLAEVR